MSHENELKKQIESLTSEQAATAFKIYEMIQENLPAPAEHPVELPEELRGMTLGEKLDLLRMLEENHIPAAWYKAQRGKTDA